MIAPHRRTTWLSIAMAGCLLGGAMPVCGADVLSEADHLLLSDAADGRLDKMTLAEAALIASGSDEGTRRSAIRKFNRRLAEFRQLSLPLDEMERARIAYEFMHRELLVGEYQADLNDFAGAIADGDFNCVTATLLFHCLAEEVDVSSRAVAIPKHVFSRLDAATDVETTCPDWFEQQSRAPHEGRVIGNIELLAKLYYNRGVKQLHATHFRDALDLIEASLALDPIDSTALANRLAGLNNWALARCEAKQFAAAAELIYTGLALDDQYEPLLSNDLHIHHLWAEQLCGEGDWLNAIKILERRRVVRPDVELFVSGRRIIYRRWLQSAVADGSYADKESDLEEARVLLRAADDFTVWEASVMASLAAQLELRGRPAEAERLRVWSQSQR